MHERMTRAIDNTYSDTTVSQTETYSRLQEIIKRCKELQESLEDADQNQ